MSYRLVVANFKISVFSCCGRHTAITVPLAVSLACLLRRRIPNVTAAPQRSPRRLVPVKLELQFISYKKKAETPIGLNARPPLRLKPSRPGRILWHLLGLRHAATIKVHPAGAKNCRHPESHREAVLLQEIAAAGQRGRCRPAANCSFLIPHSSLLTFPLYTRREAL